MFKYFRRYWPALALPGLIAAVVTYAEGAPIGVPAVCLFLVPGIQLYLFLFCGKRPRAVAVWKRTRSYRSLILIYGIVLLVAVLELQNKPPELYGNPDVDFVETVKTLYPSHSQTDFFRGRDAEMSITSGPVTSERIVAQSTLTAELYNKAIVEGMKSNEDLLYNYALALIRMQADEGKIDAAIADWKKNFPCSKRRSLAQRRQLIEDQLQKLRQYEATMDRAGQ